MDLQQIFKYYDRAWKKFWELHEEEKEFLKELRHKYNTYPFLHLMTDEEKAMYNELRQKQWIMIQIMYRLSKYCK